MPTTGARDAEFCLLGGENFAPPAARRENGAPRGGVERQCSRFGTARRRGPCAATIGLAHESERRPARLDIPRRQAACRSRRRSRRGLRRDGAGLTRRETRSRAYRSSTTRRQRSPIWPSRWVVWSSGTVPGTSSARRPPRSTDRRGNGDARVPRSRTPTETSSLRWSFIIIFDQSSSRSPTDARVESRRVEAQHGDAEATRNEQAADGNNAVSNGAATTAALIHAPPQTRSDPTSPARAPAHARG